MSYFEKRNNCEKFQVMNGKLKIKIVSVKMTR